MISENIIEKVKEQNDIVDIVSENVKLKKVGKNYIGLCPFHNEKTPSFSVSQEKQIYKCFGCGEAGNVITFVMKIKNYSFTEAVEYLADKVNIQITVDSSKNVAIKNKNNKLYKLNVDAARYYFNNLQRNKKAIEYFTNRGITIKTIRKFGLGYALPGWNNTLNYLESKGYTKLDLLKGGLIVKGRNNSLYDRFRNRVIFPVFDYRGRVIGFGGRVLDDSKPKYLNSPETLVFKKGINLYGLNFVIKNNNNRTLIIVEGYMDCISLHQYGVTNVVASLGTALTYDQARLLKRYADKIIISYDADIAGQSATLRGLEILKKEGFDLKVLIIPEGKDPDEFIRNNGKEAFNKLIDASLPFIDYRIKMAKSGLDFSEEGKIIEYINRVCHIISALDPIEKDIYVRKVSKETGINEHAIYDLLNEKNKSNTNNVGKVYTKYNFGQKLYLEPGYMKVERKLLKIMYQNIDYCDYINLKIKEEDLILKSHRKIFKLINQFMKKDSINDIDNLEKHMEINCDDIESSKEWIHIQQLSFVDNDNPKELINDYIKEIRKFKLEGSKEDIMKKIRQYEQKGLFEESLSLVKKLESIQKDIIEINNLERR